MLQEAWLLQYFPSLRFLGHSGSTTPPLPQRPFMPKTPGPGLWSALPGPPLGCVGSGQPPP